MPPSRHLVLCVSIVVGLATLKNSSGTVVARARVGPIAPPNDLFAKTAEILLAVPEDLDLKGCTVEIDPDQAVQEITTRNNVVCW